MKRFSIIIPTTRPHFLSGAVRSVLSQTFENFELIISDNSFSDDVKSFYQQMDDRIEYIRPERFLNVSDHWNFAINKASGEWQILLCDDDALIPSALSILDKTIKKNPSVMAITWSHASFQHDGPRKGALDFRLGAGSFELNENSRIIKEIFKQGTVTSKLKRLSPNMPMSACHFKLLNEIRALSGGNIFYPPEPMTSMSMLAMVVAKQTMSINLPLTILGSSFDSATGTARQVGGEELTVFEKTNGNLKFNYVPVGSAKIFPSHKAEAILWLKELLPEKFSMLELNYAGYFSHCYLAIREIALAKHDAKPELTLFFNDLRKQQVNVKIRVLGFIGLYWVSEACEIIIRFVKEVIKYCFNILNQEALKKNKEVLLFDNIVEAGKFLNDQQFGVARNKVFP